MTQLKAYLSDGLHYSGHMGAGIRHPSLVSLAIIGPLLRHAVILRTLNLMALACSLHNKNPCKLTLRFYGALH
ncbi:TPA: hypothetical protein ACH3X2_002529 [Trebouxia sp. C0005]